MFDELNSESNQSPKDAADLLDEANASAGPDAKTQGHGQEEAVLSAAGAEHARKGADEGGGEGSSISGGGGGGKEPRCGRLWSETKRKYRPFKMTAPHRDLLVMAYEMVIINGCTYCRRHLKRSCHLCEVAYTHLNDEADAERRELGLRPVGDPGLDAVSDAFEQEVQGKHMRFRLLQEELGSTSFAQIPLHIRNELDADQNELNSRYLRLPECTHCAYWKCSNPLPASPLLKCSSCKLVKYCCHDHQKLDWAWEHKGECCVPRGMQEELDREYSLSH